VKLKKNMFIFVLICITVFFVFYYIFCVLGNNKHRNQNEIVDDILNNIKKYEANISVTAKSNKNESYYTMKQEVEGNNSKLIINTPENIKDMTIEINNNVLKITNTRINMEKIYNDYEFVLNNNLFLNTFIEDYKKSDSKAYEQNDEIILETKLNNNTYVKFKELHLDKITGNPKELIIKDNTQKTCIRIIYNDIKIK